MVKSTPRTPEEIQKMREEIAAFEAEEARKNILEIREAAKPLLDLVDDGTLQKVLDAVPALEKLSDDRARFPHLRAHVEAIRISVEQVVAIAGSLPTVAADPTDVSGNGAAPEA